MNWPGDRHWHEWSPGAFGPCEGRVGQYAQCSCGAQCFVSDDGHVAILFSKDRRSRRPVPRAAVTGEERAS